MIFYIIAILGFCADRVIKYFAIKTPSLIQGVFINEKFALSLPVSNSISAILMGAGIIVLLHYAIKKKRPIIWVIISGAMSNFIDRIFYNGVIDYMHAPFGGIINIADIMISIGVLILIVYNKKLK